MLPGVLSSRVSSVLGAFSVESGVVSFSNLLFIYSIIKTTLLQNTAAISQLPCSAHNLKKNRILTQERNF